MSDLIIGLLVFIIGVPIVAFMGKSVSSCFNPHSTFTEENWEEIDQFEEKLEQEENRGGVKKD